MLKIIDKSSAIVIYRCSPGQKAQITQIVKDNMKESITLAIGDGANDVNMIQQAHIGVGVFGKEGNQAACFSDYAIPQFKVLRRLLFWHGRSFGVRFSNFVKWFLYKNINTSFFAFWFNLQNGFSASSNYDDIFYALYEITCTAFAILIYFIFDQGIDMRMTDKEDKIGFKLSLYYQHCKQKVLGKTTLHYWFWCLYSFVSCAALYFIP